MTVTANNLKKKILNDYNQAVEDACGLALNKYGQLDRIEYKTPPAENDFEAVIISKKIKRYRVYIKFNKNIVEVITNKL